MDTVNKAKAAPADLPTRPVVRAKEDIAESLEITMEMLELVETADDATNNDPDFEDIDTLVGRVAGKAIPQGVTLLASMITPPGTPAGVPGKIDPGYRAVGVRIDEVTGVAFNVRPGAWVDVIVVMDVNDPDGRGRETIAEVVLQNIHVAAVGLSSTGTAVNGKNRLARSVTLLVPEAEVPKLHLAATRGKLTLAMRGEHDVGSGEVYTARGNELFTGLKKRDPNDDAQSPKLLAKLAELAAKLAELRAKETETVTMLIARGSTVPGRAPSIERITYESADSWKVLSVTMGMPSSARALLQAQATPLRMDRSTANPDEPTEEQPYDPDEE